MGTLIIRLVEHLRLRARTGQREGLRHVIVIEEAHRLLRAGRRGRASAHAVELFASMLAEIRAYGEGLVIAEQIPAKLVPDVVKNTALKVVHRLPARDDRDLVGAAMNLDEDQSRQVVSLPPGVAAVFADGMDRPVRVRVPFGAGREAAAPGPAPPLVGEAQPRLRPGLHRGARLHPAGHAPGRTARLGGPGGPGRRARRGLAQAVGGDAGAGLPHRPRPQAAPAPLRRWWPGLDRRLRECLLATVLDRAVRSRTLAIRTASARPSWPVPRPVPRCGCSARAPGRPPGPCRVPGPCRPPGPCRAG